jgi:hypothetical protein
MKSFTWCPLHTGEVFDLVFKLEEGEKMLLRNVGEFIRTINRYIPEYNTLHSNRHENLEYIILTEWIFVIRV